MATKRLRPMRNDATRTEQAKQATRQRAAERALKVSARTPMVVR